MKIVKYALATALIISSGFAKELTLGSAIPLPDTKLKDVSGADVTLASVQGTEGLVVIFSSNTCPWVKAWEGRYVELAENYQNKGFGFIALNSNEAFRLRGDGLADMQAVAKEKGYNFAYAVDEESLLARAFGANKTPHIYVFNASGLLVYRGALDDNAYSPEDVEMRYVGNALDDLLADREVVVASSKAMGCAIKFSN